MESGHKKMTNRSIEHLRPLHLCFKKGNNRPYPVTKYLPDLSHMFILHLDSVANEFGSIFSHLILLDDSVDNHTANGDTKFVEPVDKAGDDGDRQAFGESDKKESGEGFVGQEVLRMGHSVLEAQEVVQEGILFFFFRER